MPLAIEYRIQIAKEFNILKTKKARRGEKSIIPSCSGSLRKGAKIGSLTL
jgi:hypothetical protein